MMRAIQLLLAVLPVMAARAQESGPAVVYTRAVAVPLNGVLLFDKANEAWAWTFGREPGAKLISADRDAGTIEGSARVNFRSAMLTLREESAGFIQYRVQLVVSAGECRITVSELQHTGNRTTARGGVHLGRLAQGPEPLNRVRGTSGSNAKRLYAEVKDAADARISALIKAFEARLRASAEP